MVLQHCFECGWGKTFTSEFFHESNVEHIEITPISWTSEFQKQKRNNVICVHK